MNDASLTKKSKEKFDFIDLLKAIAIYFVVIYHFNDMETDFITKENQFFYLNYFIKSILGVCVPLFFFVNGALLLNKSELDIKKHVRKIINISILIVVWGVITIIALSFIRNESLSFFEVIIGVFKLKMGWINHLWFLEAIIVIYIFLPLIFTTYKNNLKHFYFFFVCVMLLTFGNTLITSCAETISYLFHTFTSSNFNRNYFSDFNAFRGIFGYSIGYFLLGGVLFYYKDILSTKTYRILALIAIPVSMIFLFTYGIIISRKGNQIWDIVWNGYDSIFTVINVAAIYIISIQYKHKGTIGKGIKLIGENSLGIYFLHVILGSMLKPIYLNMAFSTSVFSNFIFALIILLFTLLLVVLLKKVPVIRYLFMIN